MCVVSMRTSVHLGKPLKYKILSIYIDSARGLSISLIYISRDPFRFLLKSTTGGVLSWAEESAGGTSWQAIKTSTYTASAGEGVFANTTSGAFTVNLPSSPTLGDEVSIVDYAGTFDTNNLTVGRNSQPIMGTAADLTVSIERAGLTLVYVDGTQGWLLKDK